ASVTKITLIRKSQCSLNTRFPFHAARAASFCQSCGQLPWPGVPVSRRQRYVRRSLRYAGAMPSLPLPTDSDWPSWLRRYDTQQAAYLPAREERFTAMLNVLGALLPEEFVALDLACGPGSISQRLLERFPRARAVAVDVDPVLLAMGQGALGDFD